MKFFAMLAFLPVVALAAENLLRNPDFETLDGDGTFADWRPFLEQGAYAGPARSVSALQGGRCLELCCPQVLQSGAVIQRCRVDPRKKYLFGGLFLGRSGYARINCYDEKGAFKGNVAQIDLTIEPGTYTWCVCNRCFVPSPETAYVEVVFDMWARVCKGSGYADRLYLGECPTSSPGRPSVTGTVASGRVVLDWTPCEGATAYLVYKAYFPDQGTGEAVALVTGNRWVDAQVDSRATRCFYRVAALDDTCQGNLGDPVEIKIKDLPPETPVTIGVFSPFQKIRRHEFLPQSVGCLSLELARNETAAGQLVLCSPGRALGGIGVAVEGLCLNGRTLQAGEARVELFREEYQNVERPCVMREGMQNLPGWIPDPLLPWQNGLDVPKGENQGVWLKLRTTSGCSPGRISGTVVVREGGRKIAAVPLQATVYDFALPDRPSYPSSVQIRYDRVFEAFGFKEGSEQSDRVVDRYVEMLLDHRLNPLRLPYGLEDERGRRFLEDPRLRSLGLPTHDFSRLGEFQSRLKRDYGIEGYVYVEDEPGEGDFPRCRDTAALVHGNKGVPYLLTTAPHPKLVGSVDIWVPSLQDIDWAEVERRRAAGDRVWWYTSLVPRSPFPTFLIEDCGVAPRALAWLQVRHRIEGFLYWDICMHRCLDDPGAYDGQVWDTPRLYREGNGDGFLVYPGKRRGIEGPVTSIRLETILEGNEELEYFALYRRLLRERGDSDERIADRVENLIDPAAQSLTQWSLEPTAFDRQRRRLVAEILRLLGKDGRR